MKKYLWVVLVLTFFNAALCLAENNSGISKKKIVFVKDDDGPFFNAVNDLFKNLLEQKGYIKDNSDYITLSVEGKEEKNKVVVEEIKKIKPDVVLINTTLILKIAMPMKDSGIPFVAGGGLELEDEDGKMILVNEKGEPKYNITGTYTMPRRHIENSFEFLNQIAPIKGKKAVFITMKTAAFNKKKVESGLKKIGVELKEYKESEYVEEWQEFFKKYNEDEEVAWIISGETVVNRKDGKPYTREDMFKWMRENVKKPGVNWWENTVVSGEMCALAIDSMTTVGQMMDMADRILKGENIKSVKPEDPKKSLILINMKRVKELEVEVPLDILGAAWRVYTDYEGHYIGQE